MMFKKIYRCTIAKINISLIIFLFKAYLRNDLPSHPPDPVIEVVADDAASSLLIYSTVTGRAAAMTSLTLASMAFTWSSVGHSNLFTIVRFRICSAVWPGYFDTVLITSIVK